MRRGVPIRQGGEARPKIAIALVSVGDTAEQEEVYRRIRARVAEMD